MPPRALCLFHLCIIVKRLEIFSKRSAALRYTQNMQKYISYIKAHRWQAALVLAGLIAAPLVAMVVSYWTVSPNAKYILADAGNLQQQQKPIKDKDISVGLVLGAGVDKQGRPYKELRARLDVAAAALQRGDVDKLILSGDNRFKFYDEPTAMKKYLMQTYGIASTKLQPDFAGRSTYESCQRAAQVFEQKRLVLFSAQTHLPRAIYLCRHFGIETYGIASTLEANNAVRREAVARVKAVYNVYVKGEPTILGTPIHI